MSLLFHGVRLLWTTGNSFVTVPAVGNGKLIFRLEHPGEVFLEIVFLTTRHYEVRRITKASPNRSFFAYLIWAGGVVPQSRYLVGNKLKTQ
jgi:hypothetical protein